MDAGINMTRVKRQNKSLILKYLNKTGPVSRKDIAEAVGLTGASVTNICAELLEEKLIYEVGVDSKANGSGRPKILVDINYDSRLIFAFNIEADRSTVALCNMAGSVVDKKSIETDSSMSPKSFLLSLCHLAKEMSQYNVSAVSIGIVGPVDKENGISKHAYGIWKEPVDIKSIVEEEMKLPCIVENNVNAITKATMLLGIGRKYDNLHIIKWGPGVGSAVVIDGEIYEGINGRAAEMGHIIIEKNGLKCTCGRRGCLETRVSISALQRIAPFDRTDFYEVYKLADSKARHEFDLAIDLFARAIVNTITLFAPNCVVLSGYLFNSSQMREKVIEACKAYSDTINKSTIIANSLMKDEDFIGPVGAYLYEVIN